MERSPIQPLDEPPPLNPTRPYGKQAAIAGIVMQCGSLLGVWGTASQMVQAFESITLGGTGDTQQLSSEIGNSMAYAQAGFLVGQIGIIALIYALFIARYRAPWLFGWTIAASLISLINVPIGTIMAIVFIVYVIRKREEFQVEQPMPDHHEQT